MDSAGINAGWLGRLGKKDLYIGYTLYNLIKMIEVQLMVKKWGNSLGMIIPAEIVQNRKLKEGSTIEILIPEHKKMNIADLFGSLKDAKIDAQKMKDESRKIWDM